MSAPVIYLLKANVVLLLFMVAYYGLLRRLTFFGLNRAYLLLALVFAVVYPALPMPGLLPAEAPAPQTLPIIWVAPTLVASLPVATASAASQSDWPALALWLYAGGAVVLLGRLLVQLLALARLRRATQPAITPAGVPYRQLPAPGNPFSFGRTIYLHAGQHPAAELAVVVTHEQAHVRQGHTFDVLLAHVGTALFWPNPAAWLLRRALLDNLEYLADVATLRTGLERRAYQYCLLQLSRGAAGPALALSFAFLTLKNRVAMMNTPLSSTGQLARYFLAGPLVVLAALGYSAAHARPAVPTNTPTKAHTAASNSLSVNNLGNHSQPDLAPTTNPVAQPTAPVPSAPRAIAPVRLSAAGSQPVGPEPDLAAAAQAAPTPLYYLDGQVITEAQFKAITPADIANIQILKGEQARQLAGDKGKNGVIIITTTANQNTTTVVSFNQRVQRLAPLQAGAGSSELPANMVYYVDGKQVDKATLDRIAPADMLESINVLKADQTQQRLGLSAPAMIVTTKANAQSPAVLAFNEKAFPTYNFTQEPAQVNALVPKALAYITSHYPDARLSGEVIKLTAKDTGATKYRVQLINGKRPFYVYFTPQGEFAGGE